MNQDMTGVNVDLSQADDVVCERCGNYTFEQVALMKKVSALISPSGRAGVIPIPVFACSACGNVNDGFMPVIPKSVQEERKAEATKPRLVLE
jgi:hypothetical protein